MKAYMFKKFRAQDVQFDAYTSASSWTVLNSAQRLLEASRTGKASSIF
jgi:hypothetical protein